MRPVRTLLAGTAVGAVAAALVVGPSTSAGAADSWAVPRQATVVLPGHGYGHGNGMSQHGAQGAALAGLDHREIMEFYYAGTTWTTIGGRIRVLIGDDTSDDVVVVAEPGLKVRDIEARRTWLLPDDGAERWRLVAISEGRTKVQYLHGGRWHGWKRFSGDGQFQGGDGTLELVLPSGTMPYRGTLRAASPRPGEQARDTVNVLSLEKYLRGVVPHEMPALWEPEAVRAQAVAARTYAASERSAPRGAHFDVYDTTQSQVYGGVDAEHPASNRAIRATRRDGLAHGDEPAFTQFSASNGGWSSAGLKPYLVSRADPYDGWDGNTHHDWRVRVHDTAIEREWDLGNLRRIEVLTREGGGAQWGGRVEKLRLHGSKRSVTMSGDDFRFRLGLKSTWFTFRVRQR